jgi:hypothetical protein
MSNYLAQIAARNAAIDQPLLAPAHSAIEAVLDDPFDQPPLAAGETTGAMEEIRPAGNLPHTGNSEAPVAQPVKDKPADAAPSIEIKPVYLTKYIERHQNDVKDDPDRNITQVQSNNVAVPPKVGYKLSPVLREKTDPPAETGAGSEVTIAEKIVPVKQKVLIEKETSPGQKVVLLKPVEKVQEQGKGLLPVSAANKINKTPVFLQPHQPSQPQEFPQKEKPVPSLVIGKITVEIVPAQKPVNKIINHVVKPQPVTPASTQRSKHSFGLGQL